LAACSMLLWESSAAIACCIFCSNLAPCPNMGHRFHRFLDTADFLQNLLAIGGNQRD
jgi:hypothetical protein